jgi:hypothetical protein
VGQLDTEHEALEVQVLGREVVLLGPRVAIALSAAAAAETARRLASAASSAMAGEEIPTSHSGRIGLASVQPSQTLRREE